MRLEILLVEVEVFFRLDYCYVIIIYDVGVLLEMILFGDGSFLVGIFYIVMEWVD